MSKNKNKKGFGLQEMVNILQTIPEVREAYTQAELLLYADDAGWARVDGGDNANQQELTPQLRRVAVLASRRYQARDPLSHQAVRLWTDYSLGAEGMTIEANSSQADVDAFMQNPRNSRSTTAKGQQRLSRKLLIDGEIFFVIADVNGDMLIRTIDPLQVELICDPDDEETVLCYKRTLPNSKILYYKDWATTDEMLADYDDGIPVQGSSKVDVDALEENTVVYHLTFDETRLRGNGLLFPVIDWSREHRRFMEARVSIVQALSQYALKTKVSGGQGTINKIQTALAATASKSASSLEKNPAAAKGSNLLSNAGIDINPFPRQTGAGDAKGDGDQLKLMFCAGVNIMLHYLGDPSTGNLASTTSMELPMAKAFGGYQKLWKDAWTDIISIVLQDDPTDRTELDIDYPAILEDDLTALGTAIASITTVFPEFKVPEVQKACLRALKVDDVDEVMKTITAKRAEIDANTAKGLNPDGSKPQPVLNPAVAKQTQESLDRLSKVLESLL